MAKFDRCSLCDYTEDQGSEYSSVLPYANGKVRNHHGTLYCQKCFAEIIDTYETFPPAEEKDVESS